MLLSHMARDPCFIAISQCTDLQKQKTKGSVTHVSWDFFVQFKRNSIVPATICLYSNPDL